MAHPTTSPPTRRQFLALTATALAVPSLGPTAGRPRRTAPLTPEAALQLLLEGNARFAAGRPTAPHRDLSRLRETAQAQAPFAAVLTCADSRVPVEILFDQGLGDVFVVRNAGNVVSSEEMASLEFGTLVLGARVLVVLGHSSCGAVKATIAGGAVPGQISTIYQHIRPAVDQAGPDLDRVIAQNVRNQAHLLASASPVIAGLVTERKLLVVGATYDLATGRVTRVAAA